MGNGLFQMNCKCKLSFPNQHMKLCHYEPQGLAMCLWCQLDDISFFDLCFQIYLVLEVSISDQALNYTTIVRANLGPWVPASCFSRCSDIMFLNGSLFADQMFQNWRQNFQNRPRFSLIFNRKSMTWQQRCVLVSPY